MTNESSRIRRLCILIGIIVVLSNQSIAQNAVQDITATQYPLFFLKNPAITIDGVLEDWPALLPIILDNDQQIVNGKRTKENYWAGVITIFFDEQNVYLAADFQDTTPFMNTFQQAEIWRGDCLEIYLGFHDAEHPSFGEGDFQFGMALLPDKQATWNWTTGQPLNDAVIVISPTARGGVLEAKIPLTNFKGAQVSPSSPVWLDFAIDNSVAPGSERIGQLMWHGDANNYQRPSLWEKGYLTENPADFDQLLVIGPALMKLKAPYQAQIFYKKQPWQGSLTVNGQNQSTDANGRFSFRMETGDAALLAFTVDGNQYEKRIFANKRARRKYFQQLSGQGAEQLPPIPADAPYKNAALPVQERVANLLSYMTLEEKVGQMAQVARDYLEAVEDITDFSLGSILSGGGSGPAKNTPEEWVKMYNQYQQAALQTRLGIPIIYGIDAVHGHNNVRGATIFPHNIGLGATRDPDLVERIARITAIEVAATGIDWTFAPCIAVARDERWGRTYESFSEDPELVAQLGAAAVRGYQGASYADPTAILATAKHYAGDGGTTGGKDQGNVELPEADFRAIHLRPYPDTLAAGVGSVMPSFSSWNGQKMHGNKYLLTDVLRQEMGFQGLVVSDWAAVKQLSGNPKDQIQAAINAGIDMVMIPDDYISFVNNLAELVKDGSVPQTRIDEAVRRILTTKFAMGLFEKPFADMALIPKVGSAEHRAVAREAVRKSVVLLKNESNILPLSKTLKHIHIAGKISKDLGSQCGGWTITWQGQTGSITEGTNLFEAIKQTVSPETKITYSRDGTGGAGADVMIAVLGESPYAEFEGDSSTLALSPADTNLIANAKQAGVPIVAVLISGRPLIITNELAQTDAFLAAWLPGTEGQGVADVLFGDYTPTGKLSFTWPKRVDQLPINIGDGQTDPLFPYGFGLSY